MAKYVGDLEKTCSVILEKTVRRFGENLFGDFWRKRVGDLEKSFSDIGENRSAIWRKLIRRFLTKTCRRFRENRSAITLEIWRNVVGAVMSISYWSSLWSSIELIDRKWGLNHNGEKVYKLWRLKLYST